MGSDLHVTQTMTNVMHVTSVSVIDCTLQRYRQLHPPVNAHDKNIKLQCFDGHLVKVDRLHSYSTFYLTRQKRGEESSKSYQMEKKCLKWTKLPTTFTIWAGKLRSKVIKTLKSDSTTEHVSITCVHR